MFTLLVGALGATYPYGFLDPDKLGHGVVARNGLVFLAAFYGLGLGLVAAARVLMRDAILGRRYWPKAKPAGGLMRSAAELHAARNDGDEQPRQQ